MNILSNLKNLVKKKFFKPKKFDFYYNLGIDFYDKKNYEQAIQSFQTALEQDDVKSQVYYNLALSYQCLKNYTKAIAIYDRFLEQNPADYDGIYNLALTYYLNENYTKAVEFFEKSIELRQEEDNVRGLALAYLAQKEMQKTVDFADDLLNIPNLGLKLYATVAKVFENRNEFKDFTYTDQAIGMYFKMIARNSTDFNSYLSLSFCFAKKGEWEHSVEFCEKALETNPESYEANDQMGLVYYCCGETQKAVDYYEIALKLKPEGDYKVYSNLGYAYEKLGQKEKAIKIFSKLLKKFPQCPPVDEIKRYMLALKKK